MAKAYCRVRQTHLASLSMQTPQTKSAVTSYWLSSDSSPLALSFLVLCSIHDHAVSMLEKQALRSPGGRSNLSLEESRHSTKVSSKVLKKREVDRRCQRKAREKTKARIAELEGLLEEFQARDVDGGVAALRKKLEEVEADRNRLVNTLKSLESIIQSSRSTLHTDDGSSRQRPPTVVTCQEPSQSLPVNCPNALDAAFIAFANDGAFGGHQLLESTTEWNSCEPGLFETSADWTSCGTQSIDHLQADTEETFRHTPLSSEASSNHTPHVETQRGSHRSVAHANLNLNDVFASIDAPLTQTDSSCACVAGGSVTPRPNLWRFANDILAHSFRFRGYLTLDDDATNQDIAIRAVLHGWDALASAWTLPISWQILRRIDETLFSTCGKTERLAILQVMHLLLHFHEESTVERHAKLPLWYRRTPSQNLAHSYAINFFAWPGLRERFILSEHRYCGNEFWDVFASSLRIRWQFAFHDCFYQDPQTGLQTLSPLFAERIADIQNWTMGREIFEKYPEFYSDIPALHPSLRPVSNKTQLQLTMHHAEEQRLPIESYYSRGG